ncbi:MAG: hypothetical protein HYT03_00080 [Candidatus Harrisonbacteria bacterium]|nr:hypothetical protein [Candidatus Harrisonbacteria bacterium]
MAEDQNFQSPKQVPSEDSALNQPGSPGYVYRPKSQRSEEQNGNNVFKTPAPKPPSEPMPSEESAPEPIQPPVPPSETEASPDFLAPETVEQGLPPAEVMDTSPIPGGVERKPSAIKTILMVFLAIAFIAGVGALTYFVILPLVFPQGGETPTTTPVSQPTPTPTPQLASHQSFLISPAAANVGVALSDLQYLTIVTALQEESLNPLADGQVKEVRLSDSSGQVAFPRFLTAVAPVTSALGVNTLFENDFTALLYYDALGTWPVYIAKLKSDITPQSVSDQLREIDSVLEIGNFYILPPGSFSSFRSGQYQVYSTRYAAGTQSGASFNYGIFGPYLILSTSFDGLKATLPLLGL